MKLFTSPIQALPFLVFMTLGLSNGAMLGGWSDSRNPSDGLLSSAERNEINRIANKAVELMGVKKDFIDGKNGVVSSGAQTLSLMNVNSERHQVVAGMKYDLNMDVKIDNKEVACRVFVLNMFNTGEPDGTWSVLAETSDPCYPYTDSAETESPEVHVVKRSTRQLLGGEHEASVENEGVKAAARWALERHNAGSNALFRQGLVRVSNVRKQVINGYRYRFNMVIGETVCRNSGENTNKDLTDCPLRKDSEMKECQVSVVHSLGEYNMEQFDCQQASKEIILGGDDHDLKPHRKQLLGSDDHDYRAHTKSVLGGDNHDYQPHGKPILGGDDHDYQPHRNPILGGDDHDYQPHGKPILGGDDHDYQPHRKPILGGDDHDYQPHGKPILGGDDHDYKPHIDINHIIPNVRDFLPKGRPYYAVPEDLKLPSLNKAKTFVAPTLKRAHNFVNQMNILGGDDHDYRPHADSDNLDYEKHDSILYHQCADEFKTFKASHKKLYGSQEEETKRFKVFCDNMERVKYYQKHEQGTAVYGATKFADLTEEEFKKQYLGLKQSAHHQSRRWPLAKTPDGPRPPSWDWRDHGAVTPVKNQGMCGSCWAFSTTGNIEGQWAIVNKKLLSLSEQELVDCDKIDEGCNGGLPSQAYDAIMKIGGLETEADYKYDGRDEKCMFNQSEVVASLVGAVNISQNEDEMATWLYHNGPISIGINAFAMQFYLWGIAHPWKFFCDPNALDHGVLIVGYGVERGEPYWIVKNSWGEDWGRSGYYYVYRGDGTCGLNRMCTSAQVKKQ